MCSPPDEGQIAVRKVLLRQILLKTQFSIPENFEEAYERFVLISDFMRRFVEKYTYFPCGIQRFSDLEVRFPDKLKKINIELKDFKRKQLVNAHVRKAKWEIHNKSIHGRGFAMENQRVKIRDFCLDFLYQNSELPVGKFEISGIEVRFDI